MRRFVEHWGGLRGWMLLVGILFAVLAGAPAYGQPAAPSGGVPLDLTEPERAWLAQHRDIRIGVNPAYPPFDFFDDKGVFVGMSADYVALITKRLGVTMRVADGGLSWSQVLDEAKDGRIDVVVGVKATEARQAFLNFTKDYLTFPLVIMTRDTHPMIVSLYGLRAGTLSIVDGFASSADIRARHPDLKFRVAPSPLDTLQAVERGEVDATVINLGSASYLIAKYGIRGVVVAAPSGLEDARSAFGVRKDWPELVSLIDKALASITPQEERAIREKWIAAPYDARASADRWYAIVIRIAGGATIIVILVVLWNRRLKGEVRRRRAAEETAARQMSLQSALFEHMPALIAHKDIEGRFVSCNRAYEQAFGVRRDDILGKSTMEVVAFPEAQRTLSYAGDMAVLQSGEPMHRQQEIILADGKPHDILLWRIPLRLPDGTPGGLLTIMVDDSEQRMAERAVADQLIYQRALLDTVPNPIYIKDQDARFIGCNLAYEQAFHATREALVGKTVHELPHIPPEMREMVYERDHEILRTGKSAFSTERLPFWDGPRDVLFWINRFNLADGSVGGLVGAIVDVSEQKALEHQAQDAERRLREMADAVPGVVYQLRIGADGSRAYGFMSDAVKSLRGYSREEALADYRLLYHQVVEDDRAAIDKAIRQAVETLSPMQEEFRIRMADGSIKWLQSAAVPTPAEDGAVTLNGYWVDVTQHRDMEIELAAAKTAADAANRAKSSFLAAMSHEIRTPMNGVLGMLELLSLTRLDSEQRSNVEVIRDSGRSLLRIVDDILDFSKIEADMLDLRPEPASPAAIVRGVRDVYSGAASAKRLILSVTVDPDLSPAVMVDPLRLRQILNNFVSNALKFTPQGSVTIAAELVERKDGVDTVRFSVADTGIGIAPENQAKLFQPFVQAEGDTTRRFGGTGLGLVICRRLADLMGGTIEMDSAVGQGTTMRLVVPLPQADPSAITEKDNAAAIPTAALTARRPAPSVDAAIAEGTLVLVADDHPTNRMMLLRQLNLLGYAAEAVEDGKQALDAWHSGRFGLVLTDCHMPEMDGYDLARSIRLAEGGNGGERIPIIACTANVLEGEAEACLAAGMDSYLPKPVELSFLLRMLDAWLPLPGVPSPPATDAPPSAALTNGAEPSPIDRAKLAEVSLGDADFERDMLTDFRGAMDEDANQLTLALESRDSGDITRIAHRLKGASRTVGATDLATASEQMESAGRADDPAAISAAREPLFVEVERLRKHLAGLQP